MNVFIIPRVLAKTWLAFLLLYIGYRAATLSMTCDEAWTATDMPYPGLFGYITPEYIAGLNVHLLNNWLANLCMTILGESDLAVRLPALAGGGVYLVGAYVLCARLFQSWRLPASFVLLTANPYLLDFFSIGRGYALGMGCLMLGLPQFLKIRAKDVAPPWYIAWLALAVVANLSFLYVYLAAMTLEIIRTLPLMRKSTSQTLQLRHLAWPMAATLASLTLIYGQAMRIATRNNEHWWGSPDGFINGGLTSLFQVTLYHISVPPNILLLITWATLGLSFGLALVAIASCRARRMDSSPLVALNTLLALFTIVWAGVTLEHLLFGTPFLIERGMFFIYPILILIPACAAEILASSRRAILGYGALAFLFAFVLANFTMAANLDHTATWRNDACSRPFLERIRAENYPRNFTRERIRIAASHMAAHTINYYVRHMRLAFVESVNGLDRLDSADYAIMPAGQAVDAHIAVRFENIAQCPASDMVLLRKK